MPMPYFSMSPISSASVRWSGGEVLPGVWGRGVGGGGRGLPEGCGQRGKAGGKRGPFAGRGDSIVEMLASVLMPYFCSRSISSASVRWSGGEVLPAGRAGGRGGGEKGGSGEGDQKGRKRGQRGIPWLRVGWHLCQGACISADTALPHQSDQLCLGEVVGRRGVAWCVGTGWREGGRRGG